MLAVTKEPHLAALLSRLFPWRPGIQQHPRFTCPILLRSAALGVFRSIDGHPLQDV